uniref:Uncharacterized protein n=1 Tax=Tanacetum cinerariifolium TaxID=118510 RepID=A0A699IDA9_TANCI|nr:hypothetical protein [Tanacetum cinerariifolium]
MLLFKVISRGEARFLVFLSAYSKHCVRTRNSLVWGILDIKEKDKIEAKTGQNQEQTGGMEKSKVKPDKVKA